MSFFNHEDVYLNRNERLLYDTTYHLLGTYWARI
jgi:hypothetical protein